MSITITLTPEQRGSLREAGILRRDGDEGLEWNLCLTSEVPATAEGGRRAAPTPTGSHRAVIGSAALRQLAETTTGWKDDEDPTRRAAFQSVQDALELGEGKTRVTISAPLSALKLLSGTLKPLAQEQQHPFEKRRLEAAAKRLAAA